MKVVLYFKKANTEAVERMNSFLSFMLSKGIECSSMSIESEDRFSAFESADFSVVFGGDGTVLEAAALASDYDVPMLCVNVGNLGFLSEVEKTASNEEIFSMLKPNAEMALRMMLEISAEGEKYYALNEAVLKSAGDKPLKFSACVDGRLFDKYRSDGVIIATPTGSTAYALSAGGPILAPELDAITFLPICPHTLHSRPAVVASNSVIDIECKLENAALIVDGKHVCAVSGAVRVTKAAKNAKFITRYKNDFYAKLLDKMNCWGVTQ